MTYNPYSYPKQQAYGYQPYYGTGATGQVPAYGTQPPSPPIQTGTMFPMGGAQPATPPPQVPGMLPLEQSYIENILRLNKGKLANVYAFFDAGNGNNQSRTFTGIVEAAGRDHLILSDPETGNRVLLPMVYFGYATFEEELEYDYPFSPTAYQPR